MTSHRRFATHQRLRLGLRGSRKSILFILFEFRISQYFCVVGDIFVSASCVDADHFVRIEGGGGAFLKISGYVWTWP